MKPSISMALITAFVGATAAGAPMVEVSSPAFLEAALIIRTFDHYDTGCRRGPGYSATQADIVDTWQRDNGVAGIRSRFGELDRQPALKQQMEQAVQQIIRQLASKAVDDCLAAVTAAKTPNAQFAKVAPQLLVGAPAPSSARGTVPAAAGPPPAAIAAPNTTVSKTYSNVLARIDSIGFDTRPAMGYGGFITIDIYPILLLKDGQVLKDVEALTFAGGLDAHRAAHADDWTRWRRSGGELQLLGEKGWEKMEFQTTYPKLPDGFRLDGLFRRLGGAGTLGVGGTTAVAVWNEYRFFPDGTLLRGGGAGASAETGNTSITTGNVAADRRGRYRIEGLMLHVSYADGSAEHRILIADPKDPKGAIWLDGQGYVQRRK